MKTALTTLGLFLIAGLLGACAPQQGAVNITPVAAVTLNPLNPVPPPGTVAVKADLVLRDQQNGGTFTIKQGESVAIVLLTPDLSWELTYDSNYLKLLSPQEEQNHPGPTGWLFRALLPGTTVVKGRSVSPPCPSGQNCSGAPAYIFQFTLIIQ